MVRWENYQQPIRGAARVLYFLFIYLFFDIHEYVQQTKNGIEPWSSQWWSPKLHWYRFMYFSFSCFLQYNKYYFLSCFYATLPFLISNWCSNSWSTLFSVYIQAILIKTWQLTKKHCIHKYKYFITFYFIITSNYTDSCIETYVN